MRNILTALAFAACMILIAIGISRGVLERDAWEEMLFIIPGFAIAVMGARNMRSRRAGRC